MERTIEEEEEEQATVAAVTDTTNESNDNDPETLVRLIYSELLEKDNRRGNAYQDFANLF